MNVICFALLLHPLLSSLTFRPQADSPTVNFDSFHGISSFQSRLKGYTKAPEYYHKDGSSSTKRSSLLIGIELLHILKPQASKPRKGARWYCASAIDIDKLPVLKNPNVVPLLFEFC